MKKKKGKTKTFIKGVEQVEEEPEPDQEVVEEEEPEEVEEVIDARHGIIDPEPEEQEQYVNVSFPMVIMIKIDELGNLTVAKV